MKLFCEEHYRSRVLPEHQEEFVQMVVSKKPRSVSEDAEAQMELEAIQDICLAELFDKYPDDYPLEDRNE